MPVVSRYAVIVLASFFVRIFVLSLRFCVCWFFVKYRVLVGRLGFLWLFGACVYITFCFAVWFSVFGAVWLVAVIVIEVNFFLGEYFGW